MNILINISNLTACIFLILAIRSLASPQRARRGNLIGITGLGLALATSFFSLDLPRPTTTFIIILLGAYTGIYAALKVKIQNLPQMIAAFNGLGGLAAVCIALAEIIADSPQLFDNILGLIVGGIAFSGSLVAFAKLQGLITTKPIRIPFQTKLTASLAAGIIILSALFLAGSTPFLFYLTGILVILLGVFLVLPVGGADMPVIISILNACSGWAAVGIGLSFNNTLLIIVGTIVGASGSILAYIMMKAMNRSFIDILSGGLLDKSPSSTSATAHQTTRTGSPADAAFIMENANKIIIVPGFGMAAAQAQHSLKALADTLVKKYHANVKFAIHPVAGRMPGHMNVLLAEANIDYKDVYEMADINTEFSSADVAYIIGANDITNPLAKTDASSPIYGMPVLDVEKAKTVFFVKRSLNSGYSGIDNPLFYAPNTIMLYGDAKEITEQIVKNLEN